MGAGIVCIAGVAHCGGGLGTRDSRRVCRELGCVVVCEVASFNECVAAVWVGCRRMEESVGSVGRKCWRQK